MIAVKIAGILILVCIGLILLTLVIYFFNLDMKLASGLIKPLTKYYDWSRDRRNRKKEKQKTNKR